MGAARRVKVGIFFNARRSQGGLYQYALTLVDCLCRFAPEFDYVLYHITLEELPKLSLGQNWRYVRPSPNAVKLRLFLEALLLELARLGIRIPFPLIPEFSEIRHDQVDVMLYVKPGVYPFQWSYRSIFPIHDLQHRLQPEFPEVAARGEDRRREYFYTRSIPRASAILTDSETGSEDVVACYGADRRKLFALPYIAPTFIDSQLTAEFLHQVKQKYSLPSEYFFYPAAFWQHKNHARLIKAFAEIVRQHQVRIPLILAGSPRLEYPKLTELANSLEISDMVHFIGYVPDEDMPALYRQALALVMPTFFGPTNIPVLEAWMAGCAVVTSNLRGIREQVGDAGLLVEPRSEHSIATTLWSLYESPQLRAELIERGKNRVVNWTPQKFARKLTDVINYSVATS
jgi:glycosyltransferase involved in cell wall biosynthesis